MSNRLDLPVLDYEGLLRMAQQRSSDAKWADIRVSPTEQNEEGHPLGAFKGFATCVFAVMLAALIGYYLPDFLTVLKANLQ